MIKLLFLISVLLLDYADIAVVTALPTNQPSNSLIKGGQKLSVLELLKYFIGANYDFPENNTRVIRIQNLRVIPEEKRQAATKDYEEWIEEKETIYEDAKKVRRLEKELLKKGIWAFCEWTEKMPPLFDNDKQCTEEELEYLLANID